MARKKKESPPLKPEWSHKIDAAAVNRTSKKVAFKASERERLDLARRLGANSVDSAEAQMTLERDTGSYIIHVTGSVNALINQNCVVSLAPVQNEVSDTFEAWYTDKPEVLNLNKIRHERESVMESEVPVMSEKDDPEHVIDGFIDLGELATQYLSLAVSPYPRMEGGRHEKGVDCIMELQTGPARKNPFAMLKDWKLREKEEK